jgi:phage recombination protein Bet
MANETALATVERSAAMEWSDEQRKIIRDSCAPGSTDAEFRALLEVAKAKRLNPLTKQIHFVKRKAKNEATGQYEERYTYVTAIDGFRAQAQRTGEYAGQDEPEFVYDDAARIVACKVRVYRRGIERPFVGVAHWVEYVQTARDGSPLRMWATMPHHMISKCAEAQALRRGFPEETAGLSVSEEIHDEDAGPMIIDAPQRPALVAAPLTAAALPPSSTAGEETIADAVKRWRSELFTARTVEECDRIGGQIGRRLAKRTPDHDEMLTLYQKRRREVAAGGKSSPEPGSPIEPEPLPVVDREPGSDDA